MFELNGQVFACMEIDPTNKDTHIEINTKEDLVTVCDAVYHGTAGYFDF